ncbi:ABC transporter permease [Kumtagia ephedrae]|jgi:peptide/nickel transport system permease protein|uniref:ABC transporter permease n=1 Tax=Kumtagia ephedrae TaxID=2116701 RepID=A0A2P7SRU2_9HYPH|nr:ABC transporter permease [Mesorhizobium ephedrae]PSJ65157.1 ABC transporter permease [Mesorhizobium ephedrae]
MSRLVLTRIGMALISLLAVSAIIFWCVELLPGDAAERILGRNATPESLALLRETLNLHLSAPERYLTWLSNLLSGDFGTSLVADRPVLDYIASRIANTALLSGFALILYIPISIALGVITAINRGRMADHAISVVVLIFMCLPEFVIGILLISIFAIKLAWLPPLALIGQANGFGDLLRLIALPTITIVAAMSAYAVRMMRESLIEVLDSSYVLMARLKGLPTWRVLLFHALPNALGPAINITALNVAWMIGGVVVVEAVFEFPGIGRLMVDSISHKDVPVILAISMVMTGAYIATNLIADVLVILLNPKLR